MADSSPQERRRRQGRRLGIAVFAVVVAGITAMWSLQIIQQVWAPTPLAAAGTCQTGIRDLHLALRRARAAAAQEPNGERAALARFRDALLPEWNRLSAVADRCDGDPATARAVKRLTALRYAEEHAVRYEAVALAEQRRQVDAIARELLGPELAP